MSLTMPQENPVLGLAWRGRNAVLRRDFSKFIHQCFLTLTPGVRYVPNWHIDLMAEYLEACRKQEVKRLLINLPPRSLKSICVSVAWPAFLLGLDPAARIMAASYAATLSLKHSTDCRNVMLSPWYRQIFPKTQLARYQNEKRKFMTTAHGHRIATSVGGSATGEGGNFLIVDDPQNPQQAMSTTQRRHTAEWFDHTFASRLDDKRAGVMVVVMQRLHVNDLSGHLIEKGGWEQLLLPAIADAPMAYHFGRVEKWREASWLAEFERELLAFPHAPHDDQVDGLSQYLNWVRGREQQSDPTLRKI